MKVAIIGATGKVGQAVMLEALSRHYQVTAIVRGSRRLDNKNVTVLQKSIYQLTREDLANFDIVVDAFNAPLGEEEEHQTSLEHLTTILSGLDKPRLFIVGGAGSLYVDNNERTRLLDTPSFPNIYFAAANNMAIAFNKLKKVTDVNWTYLSPTAFFDPEGERTGKYKIAGNILTLNELGKSEISTADYAIAMVDEMANGRFVKQRFSVVSE